MTRSLENLIDEHRAREAAKLAPSTSPFFITVDEVVRELGKLYAPYPVSILTQGQAKRRATDVVVSCVRCYAAFTTAAGEPCAELTDEAREDSAHPMGVALLMFAALRRCPCDWSRIRA